MRCTTQGVTAHIIEGSLARLVENDSVDAVKQLIEVEVGV